MSNETKRNENEATGYVIDDEANEISDELIASFGTAQVNFRYYVNRFTPELEEECTDEDGFMLVKTANRNKYVASLLADWDVKYKKTDAAPAPIDETTLRRLPFQLVAAIIAKMHEDSSARPTNATA